MTWWMWTLLLVYLIGFVVVLVMHVVFLQMVTFPLALLRALFWPIWFATGGRWPPSMPLTMD